MHPSLPCSRMQWGVGREANAALLTPFALSGKRRGKGTEAQFFPVVVPPLSSSSSSPSSCAACSYGAKSPRRASMQYS